MKIIILTQYFPPEMGAPQSRLLELAVGLRKLSWEVEVVTGMPNYPTGRIFEGYRGKFSLKEDVLGMPVYRYWLYPSKSKRTFPRIASMLSFSLSAFASIFVVRRFKSDYLMAESPPLPLGFTGWVLARLSGAKFILNVSDLWPLSAKELGVIDEGYPYRVLEAIESFLYARADLCVGQSQEIVDHIQRKRGNAILFRNGVDTSRFESAVSTEKQFKIVYAGLLGVAQGILSLCQFVNFKSLGVEFHIYGDGNEKEQIEAFVRDHPDSGIVYKGIKKRNEIPAMLIQYDLALIALSKNIYGAVPSKIYEAMAAGLPILFSGSGEGASIVEDNSIGWTSPPSDWTSLIRNIESYLKLSASELNAMKERVRKLAEEKFDRNTQIRELHQVLLQRLNL